MVFHSLSAGRWMKVFIGCLLLVLALALYKFLQIRQLIAFAESFPEASETVEAFVVQPQTWQETTTTVGEVLAPQAMDLRNETEGRISAVGFVAGGEIKKDQMLVQLDASEEIAQLRAAQADAELAQAALTRYQKLIAQNVSSREQYDEARAQFAMATARAQALQAVIDKKTLTAPFDGQAGLHTLQPGQYLAADTVITQLVGSQKILWVDFFLPQHAFMKQQQGNASADMPVNISARGLLITPRTAHVIASEPAVSTTSRSLKLRAAIDNTDGALKPGELVDVQVATAVPREVIAVPATAIQYDSAGTFVYVISTDGTDAPRAALRSVTIGSEKNRSVLIEQGLEVGEKIAANGSYKLRDKMLVNIKGNTR